MFAGVFFLHIKKSIENLRLAGEERGFETDDPYATIVPLVLALHNKGQGCVPGMTR